MHYLWRAEDHEGEVLEYFPTKTRDKAAALRFMKKAMKRYGDPAAVVTDGLRSYAAAMTASVTQLAAGLREGAGRAYRSSLAASSRLASR